MAAWLIHTMYYRFVTTRGVEKFVLRVEIGRRKGTKNAFGQKCFLVDSEVQNKFALTEF